MRYTKILVFVKNSTTVAAVFIRTDFSVVSICGGISIYILEPSGIASSVASDSKKLGSSKSTLNLSKFCNPSLEMRMGFSKFA
jgi:hypothetical protein